MSIKNKINDFFKKFYPQILIISLILLVYIQNLWFDFAYLDDNLIVFTDFDKIDSLSKIPQTFLSGYLLDNYYRPIILISFIIDTAIGGQSSTMYHLTNIILHVLFSLLVYKLLVRFRINSKIALLSSLLFAVHPLNTNAVSWIAGRNDLIVGFFSLSSFLAFLNYLDQEKKIWLVIHFLTFFIALFSKEIGIMVLPLILIYLYFFNKSYYKKFRKITFLFSIWFIIIFIYLYLRLFVVQINNQENIGITVFLNNLYIILEYLSKFIYYPFITPLSVQNTESMILGAIFIILILTAIIGLKLFKNKLALFGLLFFILFTFPTLAIKLRTVSGEFVYLDCRVYLPLVGLIIFLASIIEKVNLENKIINSIFILFLIYSIVFAIIKSDDYRNGLKFWTEVTTKYPDVSTHWVGLGFYYFDNEHYLKAAKLVEKAIELRNDIPEYYHKAALAYEKAGLFEKSNELLKRVLEFEQDKTITLIGLIKNSLRLGKITDAINYKNVFERITISDAEKKADLYSSLAYYFSYSGLFDVSIDLMKKAINYQKHNSTYLNDLGVFYYNVGKVDSAKYFFTEALKIDPTNREYSSNLNRLELLETSR